MTEPLAAPGILHEVPYERLDKMDQQIERLIREDENDGLTWEQDPEHRKPYTPGWIGG